MIENSTELVTTEEKLTFQRNFGSHIKALRKTKKLSQEDFAALIGMSIDSVSSLERGKIFTTSETLMRIAKVHGLQVYELLIFPDNKKSANLALSLTKQINALSPELLKIVNEQVQLTLKQHNK
jgi:transcriptional regulator with XRE-family HTH domain